MKHPKGTPFHNVCPVEWRRIPNFTGNFELDAIIHHNPNSDLAKLLENHVVEDDNVYTARTSYHGYSGYTGDE